MSIGRRKLLQTASTMIASAGVGCRPPTVQSAVAQQTVAQATTTTMPNRLPVIFLAHGAPMLLDDAGWSAELHHWANTIARPTSILSISAHWEQRPVSIGATSAIPLVYDFSGFPQRFYQLQYPAPGAPELAASVRALLTARGIPVADAPNRGLDHGTYIPLMCMYPEATIPVLQISLPSLAPADLYALGQALAPLRAQGTLIVGSGFLTHNMRPFGPTTPAWANEFDAWCEQTIAAKDFDALLDYRTRAPGVNIALPTHEHFVPVIVAAGAADETSNSVSFPISGFWTSQGAGAFTRRSVQFA